ncbi:MAG: FecR domain-containing protein [Asticcacaulis sp.]
MRETSQAIDEAAAAWAVRVENAPLTPAEQSELDDWLAQDSRRLGAFAKARAVIVRLRRTRALGPDAQAMERKSAPRPDRRRLLFGGLAVAGVGAVSVMGWAAYGPKGQGFATRRGEIRLVPLSDGSSVTLNTASRIAVDFQATRRVVRLLEGEALFNVAHDPQRPFVIEAGEAIITAVKTQILVSHLIAQPVQVLVRDGLAEVKRGAGKGISLAANSRLDLTRTGLTAQSVPPTEVARALVWREGMLAFEDMPLDRAVAQFARYSDTRIVIADPALKSETVTGLFAVNDPEGFARAVATTLDLKLSHDGRDVRLSR